MFQENLNTTLKRHFHKLGGSLQNISVKNTEHQMTRPKSVQGSREDFPEMFQEKCADAKDILKKEGLKSGNTFIRDEFSLAKSKKSQQMSTAKKGNNF